MAVSDATAFSTPSNCKPNAHRSTRRSKVNPEPLRPRSPARACRRTRIPDRAEWRTNSRGASGILLRGSQFTKFCHPERSEGPAFRSRQQNAEVLRFAQDDSHFTYHLHHRLLTL